MTRLVDRFSTALVTGASSGIGAATVRLLRQEGLRVVAVARRADRLESLARETGAIAMALDVTRTSDVEARLRDIPVDVLISNAGIGRGLTGLFNTSPQEIDDAVNTNVTAALQLLRAVVPAMVARRRGHVVHVGSVAGIHALPWALYGSTKGAIHLLSQNLRMELLGTGVRHTEILPGRVNTEFFERAFADPSQVPQTPPGFKALDPEDVAEVILHALRAPQHVNLSTVEVLPTDQAMGGLAIKVPAHL